MLAIRERKPTRERRQENQDGASQWRDGREGKMEEMKAVQLWNPTYHNLSSSNSAAANITASLPVSDSLTGRAYTVCERKWRADIYILLRGIVFWTGETGLCETGCTFSRNTLAQRNRNWGQVLQC